MNLQPNIIVVICHDLGRHLACYERKDVRSPNIDSFAKSAIRFENSFCTAPQCSPSRAALWTGRFAHANGVVGLTHGGFQNNLHDPEKHLAQILRENGYSTHLFGLQHEANSAERCGYQDIHPEIICDKVAAKFVEFISRKDSKKDQPFFAQIGFFEPHRPFPCSKNINKKKSKDMTIPKYLPDIPKLQEDFADFEASISSMDSAFGSIMKAVKTNEIEQNTVILFTADHGIPFPGAKMTLYDPGIEVPLIIKLPEINEPAIYNEMISNIDIMPTLLELVNISLPANLHGRSFKSLLTKANSYQKNEFIFAEKTYHTYYDPMRTLRSQKWKLIVNFENAPYQETSPDYNENAKNYPEVAQAININQENMYHPFLEFYDLKNDPYEKNNLGGNIDHRDICNLMLRELRKLMQATGDPLLNGPMPQGAYKRRMHDFKLV